jgi:hypothetical protein
MAQTVEQQREQDERTRLIERLRQERSVKAQELAALDTKLQAAEEGDFMANLGRRELSQMTPKERAMVAAKLGHERFAQLVLGRR